MDCGAAGGFIGRGRFRPGRQRRTGLHGSFDGRPTSALSDADGFCFIAGEMGRRAMKVFALGVVLAITSTLAHAEDMAEVISRYRREHGLSTVKIDPQLTAIAERQAKAMAASGIMDHSVAGSFASRISGARMGMASENIAAGTST